MPIRLKRIYDKPTEDDGLRVLVDRIWPRGVSREDARIDRWVKDLAPSTELRKWFGHDPEKWDVFRERYRAELEDAAGSAGTGEATRVDEVLAELREEARKGRVTLLFAAKDEEHNNAVALKGFLEGRS